MKVFWAEEGKPSRSSVFVPLPGPHLQISNGKQAVVSKPTCRRVLNPVSAHLHLLHRLPLPSLPPLLSSSRSASIPRPAARTLLEPSGTFAGWSTGGRAIRSQVSRCGVVGIDCFLRFCSGSFDSSWVFSPSVADAVLFEYFGGSNLGFPVIFSVKSGAVVRFRAP